LSINPKQTDLMQVVVPSEGNDEDRFVLLYVAGSRQMCVVFKTADLISKRISSNHPAKRQRKKLTCPPAMEQ